MACPRPSCSPMGHLVLRVKTENKKGQAGSGGHRPFVAAHRIPEPGPGLVARPADGLFVEAVEAQHHPVGRLVEPYSSRGRERL